MVSSVRPVAFGGMAGHLPVDGKAAAAAIEGNLRVR